MMGVKPKDVTTKYQEMDAALVGANCGTTLECMETIMAEYTGTVPGFPVWFKPNFSLPHIDVETQIARYDVTPALMGARVVGGCCGSTPEQVVGPVKAVNH